MICERMDSRDRALTALALAVEPEMQKLFSAYELEKMVAGVAAAIDAAVEEAASIGLAPPAKQQEKAA